MWNNSIQTWALGRIGKSTNNNRHIDVTSGSRSESPSFGSACPRGSSQRHLSKHQHLVHLRHGSEALKDLFLHVVRRVSGKELDANMYLFRIEVRTLVYLPKQPRHPHNPDLAQRWKLGRCPPLVFMAMSNIPSIQIPIRDHDYTTQARFIYERF